MQILGVCMTCMEMFGSGFRIAGTKTTPKHQLMEVRELPMIAPIVLSVAGLIEVM